MVPGPEVPAADSVREGWNVTVMALPVEARMTGEMLTGDGRLSRVAEDVDTSITKLPKVDSRAELDQLRALPRDGTSRLVGSAKQHL